MPDRNVKPTMTYSHFSDDLAVDSGELDQQERHDRTHDQFPDAFHPKVNHPPAEERVKGQVIERDHSRQVEQGGGEQSEEQHHRGRRVAAVLSMIVP